MRDEDRSGRLEGAKRTESQDSRRGWSVETVVGNEVYVRAQGVEAFAGYCVGYTPGDGERRGISLRRVGGGGHSLPRRC